jgi:hypothetical protein
MLVTDATRFVGRESLKRPARLIPAAPLLLKTSAALIG